MNNRYSEEYLVALGNKLWQLINLPSSAERGAAIGTLIRTELDRIYRKGYTDGVRESKKQ
jgi:hypothetical protein